MPDSVAMDKREGGEASASLSAKTAKGAGWMIGWRLATRNLGVISTLVLVRLLSPADFGLIALASGFIGMIDALSTLGPQDVIVREPAPDRDMYDTAFTMNCLRNIVTAVIVASAAWPVAAFFSEPRLVPVLLALSLGTLVTACENIGIVDFLRDLAFHKEFRLRLTARVVGMILTIGFAVLWRNYWALVIGMLATNLVRVVQSYTMSPYRPRLTLQRWRQIIGFSLWVWGSTLTTIIWDKIDSIVIGRFLGTTAVGIFALGWEVGCMPLNELVVPLNRVLFSGLSEANRSGHLAAQVYMRVLAALALLTLPAGVGISLVAAPLIRLGMGEKWLSAVPLIQIMAVAAAIATPAFLAEALFRAEGKPSVNFRIGAVVACVKAIACIALVFAFGLRGGAVALTLSLVVQQFLYIAAMRPQTGGGIGKILGETWRPVIATAVMAAILAACGLGWEQNAGGTAAAVRTLLVACPAGALVYIVTLLGIWFAQGRPEGGERDVLRLLGRWYRPVLPARFARPPVDLG